MGNGKKWISYREQLVMLVILLALCSVMTTKALSIIADQNMEMTGSGRTVLGKGKENSLTNLTKYKHDS